MSTIDELIAKIWDDLDWAKIDAGDLGVFDAEDLQIFALRYLHNNLYDAFGASDPKEIDPC